MSALKVAVEYLFIGLGCSLLIAAARLLALIVDLPVSERVERVLAAVATAPIVGMAAILGAVLIVRGISGVST